ncbi:uncharacterized protein LOC123864294 isoform X3 [Maniola jurtina]|uniref:uncharacterized protein LOC123864294 isoform X3 n=1 Tax=Maniola jurtina TaxID=191418 RepID=UPI001E68A159|nr:uncharacterized protein LOC123864294 isoform X3 [Maniola jurtina]
MNYINTQQRRTCRENLSQSSSWQSVACRDFQEMLELLSNTDDLDMLVKLFSTLGICLLEKQQDTWKALCRSISETCHGSVPNQTFCSHLVPLCIQRCKRGNMDPISVLQSLLLNHQGNMKLFYESNGMTIFDRESLQNPACLQLLNLVVENTKPEYRDEILKASDLFRQLRSYLNKYGRNSMAGQWASIILFSHRKVIQTDIVNEMDDEHIFKDKNNKTLYNSINETKEFNETGVLLGNVLREAIDWQNQFASKTKFRRNIINGNYKDSFPKERVDMRYSYANPPNVNEKAERQKNNIFRFATDTANDLSFSFLLKENPEPRFRKLNHRKPNYTLKTDQHPAEQVVTSYVEPSLYQSYKHRAFENSTRNTMDETVLEFKPPFVSTPKRSKYSKVKGASRTSKESLTTRDHTICNKTIKNRSKFTNTTLLSKRLHNRSTSAKFLDILNGSCKTFIEGFKRMFTIKESSDNFDDKSKDLGTTNVEENNSCIFSTSTMHQRYAPVSKENKVPNWTNSTKEFSLENSFCNSCYTCNDTFVLKHKFKNDAFLQQTVKKLKLGINLYGCDFKKISRTMWPREMYMTPNVLYNLYRKLIIKQ